MSTVELILIDYFQRGYKYLIRVFVRVGCGGIKLLFRIHH